MAIIAFKTQAHLLEIIHDMIVEKLQKSRQQLYKLKTHYNVLLCKLQWQFLWFFQLLVFTTQMHLRNSTNMG
jgi:hypothetical protein